MNTGVSATLAGLSADDAVALLYTELLGRTPEAAGLSFWVGQMTSGGLTIENLAKDLIASPEYATVHAGQTADQQIDADYVNVLGRHASASEQAFWAADPNGLADAAVLIDTSTEAATHNENGLARFNISALNGTIVTNAADTAPLDNSPLTQTATVNVPGPTVFVPTAVPTAEAHDVTHTENATIPAVYQNPNGTAPFGNGNLATDWNAVTDNTSDISIYMQAIERQNPTPYVASSITEANGIVTEVFNVAGGTQNNPFGVNAARSDASINFGITGAPGFLLNPDYQETVQFTGPGGLFTDATLHTTANGTQTWIVTAASNAALIGQNIIGDDAPSTSVAFNSVNLAFPEFGSTPNAHGTYSMEIDIVKVVGLSSPTIVAGEHVTLIAS